MLSGGHVLCHDVDMSLVQTGAVPQITMAHRLRIAREFAGLDQSELAERAEMSRTTVVNYELGYRVPRRLYLRALAEATGVDQHWLETGEAPPTGDVDEAPEGDVRPKGLEPLTFWMGAWCSSDDAALSACIEDYRQSVIDDEFANIVVGV